MCVIVFAKTDPLARFFLPGGTLVFITGVLTGIVGIVGPLLVSALMRPRRSRRDAA